LEIIEPTSDRGDLCPLGPFDFDERDRELRNELVSLADPCGAWMIRVPSFEPESSLVFVPPGYDREDGLCRETGPGAPWTLEVVRRNQQLRSKKDSADGAPLTRYSLSLEAESAEAIVNAWHSVVRRTRYPQPRYAVMSDGTRNETTSITCDGVVYQYASRGFYGRAHSSGPGLAADLARLAEQVQRTVIHPSNDQIRSCVDMAKQLQEKVASTPW
jgi:hypothetical protein